MTRRHLPHRHPPTTKSTDSSHHSTPSRHNRHVTSAQDSWSTSTQDSRALCRPWTCRRRSNQWRRPCRRSWAAHRSFAAAQNDRMNETPTCHGCRHPYCYAQHIERKIIFALDLDIRHRGSTRCRIRSGLDAKSRAWRPTAPGSTPVSNIAICIHGYGRSRNTAVPRR